MKLWPNVGVDARVYLAGLSEHAGDRSSATWRQWGRGLAGELPLNLLKVLKLAIKVLTRRRLQCPQPLALGDDGLLKGTQGVRRFLDPLLGVDMPFLSSPKTVGRPGRRPSALPPALGRADGGVRCRERARVGLLPSQRAPNGSLGVEALEEHIGGGIGVGAPSGGCVTGPVRGGWARTSSTVSRRRLGAGLRNCLARGRSGRVRLALLPTSPPRWRHWHKAIFSTHTVAAAASATARIIRSAATAGGLRGEAPAAK